MTIIKYLFILLIFIASCTNNDVVIEQIHKVYIDNPTAYKYDLYINGQRNKIKANSLEILDLEDGEFHFKCLDANGKIVMEEKINIDTTILLNITKSKYLISGTLYSSKKGEWNQADVDTLVDEDKTYIGHYTILDPAKSQYKKNWNYDIDQSMPDTLELEHSSMYKSKIFLQSTYIKQYYE
jgi:hypothetical protein